MAIENVCCFTGHRTVGENFDEKKFDSILRKLIEKGVDTFICGGALGFDTIAAKKVLELKKELPQIKLHIYAPCKNQANRWSFMQKMTYNKIIDKADYVDMPDMPYFEGCMKIRNFKMVDNSSYCVAYYDGTFISGTGQTVRYAKKKGIEVINILEVNDFE